MRRRRIRTERLVLRPLTRADYEAWLEAETATPASELSPFEPGLRPPRKRTRSAFDAICERHAKRAQEDNMYALGVFLPRRRVLVGMVDVIVLQRGPLQLANLGYRIFTPHRRKGYATEAARAALHAAFRDWRLNRLEAVIDLGNRPSQQLARALGMTRECVRRKYFFQDGRFHDQVVWSAQREDYGHPPLIL